MLSNLNLTASPRVASSRFLCFPSTPRSQAPKKEEEQLHVAKSPSMPVPETSFPSTKTEKSLLDSLSLGCSMLRT
ncbi:hypothetical protein ISN44_As08g032580 [Arabidopsis suecica]|uniref:Uncharacterized protein n=1 Tax=Arabidopsis suecica TaxID=45249 RepID=A0A8T2BIS2_ARASU|nr:hypothetical protein ISN44_As08g032580 [Arabidopsis suecica]